MTPQRSYHAPPRWRGPRIERECRKALEVMVERRLREGGRPYLEAFEARRRILQELCSRSKDLLNLRAVAGERRFVAAVRYLAGPPVSADDLNTLGRSIRFARLPEKRRHAAILAKILDPMRFPWLRARRAPTSSERERAVDWTAGLWAVETVRTGRRTQESRDQERTVIRLVGSAGFRRASLRRADRPDQIPLGTHTGEISLGGPKADVTVRLRDGRLLVLECKVSNSELNSVKRLLREVGGKARQWSQLFGQQVVTAAVLRGVFRSTHVVEAQRDYGVTVFWEHDLKPLRDFLNRAV